MKYHLSSGKKANSAEAEVQSFFQTGMGEQQRKADQPEMPTPGGDTTAHTGVLLTGGG
ncbi:hypothetical protein [Pseudomonas sp. ANT_J12]|jgi:hypothetical protein|uniref:hypothetical protein n=1 Tax=Pseudomonas sp. ANT_J12 TaxID=2597351 RepID=UPI0015B78A35|nr:hypothetical protein [Pseudomonas sp. ANT_J12]